jgi:hypothetical protein
MSIKERRTQKSRLEHEADLYSAIATIDQLARHFDRGVVEETLYRKQLKSSISDVFKTRIQLEQLGFKLEDFIEANALSAKHPEGVKRLALVEGTEETGASFRDLKELPVKAADFVANAIELMDILRLRSIARVELLVPLLDEMHRILGGFPKFGADHWTVVELNGWRRALVDETPSTLLDEKDLERLEFEASRWLSEFRSQLRNL